MAVYHRTRRLQIVGDKPEVTTLFGDRYQMIVNCQAARDTEAWYNSNKDQIFADFGTLYDAQMSIDGIGPRTGEAYDNMVLVSNAAGYGRGGEYVITFVYQTLTNAFVQEAADKVDQELNGLRRVTRSLIAKDGASYGKTVGTSTISHTEHGYAAKTLTLASAVEDAKQANEGGYVRIVETWVEPGTLSVSSRNLSEGVKEVTTTFLATEGSTTGPVVRRTKENFEGLQTISVTTLQDADGSSIVDSGTNLVHEYKSFKPFQYPGVINIDTATGQTSGGNNFVNVTEDIQRPPAQAQVLATTYVFFQTASDLVQADYKYDSSAGLWSPNNWASSDISFSSAGFNGFKKSKGYRGYRTSSNGGSGTVSQNLLAFPFAQYNNSTKMGGFNTSISYNVGIEKGPPNPIGSKWVISADIKPAFDDVSGTTYYKKTLVVTDTIPGQSANAEVPYD